MNRAVRKILRNELEDAKYKGKREGWKQGYDEAANEINERVATDMLRDGEPLDKVLRYSHLKEDAIRNIAASLGISVI